MSRIESLVLCGARLLGGGLLLSLLAACSSVALKPDPVPAVAPSAASQSPAAPSGSSKQTLSAASADEAPRTDFAAWLAGFRRRALLAGMSEATLDRALDGVQYLPQLIELDRAQPEFNRPVWAYLDRAVSPQRIARGQDRLQEVRPQADAAAERYGVPATVLAAIWGMESDFGANYGQTPVIDALATLAFEGRRGAWAEGELLAALKILQNGDIDRPHMVGSWAGAMGQTQFMPTVFLAYAVDADGDGRRDIWGSMADVMASTANFLAHSGWQPGQPWGLEVQLPPGFDPGRANGEGREGRQTAEQWAAEGVRSVDGSPLPAMPDCGLLLPAGVRGPAFLVGANFRAILRYNNSINYALGVGLLAQALAGGGAVQAPWPRELQPLGRSQMKALQVRLNQLGFDTGVPDGLMGPATRAGLRRYQRSVGLPADGFADQELLDRLLAP
ncbi:MAG: lytic murein transglycosylase [Curvibacter sp.]|nr:lytic murein transglycosylase [Curvibacter sp.]